MSLNYNQDFIEKAPSQAISVAEPQITWGVNNVTFRPLTWYTVNGTYPYFGYNAHYPGPGGSSSTNPPNGGAGLNYGQLFP